MLIELMIYERSKSPNSERRKRWDEVQKAARPTRKDELARGYACEMG